jgi:hypothetical protein
MDAWLGGQGVAGSCKNSGAGQRPIPIFGYRLFGVDGNAAVPPGICPLAIKSGCNRRGGQAGHRHAMARLRDRKLGVEQQHIERKPPSAASWFLGHGRILRIDTGLLNLARRNGAEAARAMQHEPALRRFHAI